MATPYVGQNDFRGYVNSLGQSNPLANRALPYASNTGDLQGNPQRAYNTTDALDIVNFLNQARGDYQQAHSQSLADPNAAGGQTRANNLATSFDTQKQNIYGSANDAALALQPGYAQSVHDTIHNLALGQQGIDRLGIQNEASKISGSRDILDMVGRGIRSGGVYLANRNAGNSSAAGAIAQAYGEQGRRQMSAVGQQYTQNAGDIAVKQADQNESVAQAPNKFHIDLMNNVNSIVSSARDKFAYLDAQMANASMPQRIAIEQEKEKVRSQVLGSLQQYDSQLAAGVSGIHPASQAQNQASATAQLQQGQASPNLFQYSDQLPLQVHDSGPVASVLPLFSNVNKRQLKPA